MITSWVVVGVLGLIVVGLLLGIRKLRSTSYEKRGYIDPKDDPEKNKDEITFVKYKGYVLPLSSEERAFWFKKATTYEMDRHIRKLKARITNGEIVYVKHGEAFAFVTPQEASQRVLEIVEFKPQRNWVPTVNETE